MGSRTTSSTACRAWNCRRCTVASETALRGLRAPRILHIATHGVFLETPVASSGSSRGVGIVERRLSALPESGTSAKVGGASAPPAAVDNALNRSALLLAGAAQAGRASDRAQDGLLTAQEVAGLELLGTELAVLSACDSGRGALQTGQGVYGLRRAFMVAGVQTLVSSLWQVPDQETSELMVSMYQNLLGGKGRADALQAAMRAMKQRKSHPYYWAPFISIGQTGPIELTSELRARPSSHPGKSQSKKPRSR